MGVKKELVQQRAGGRSFTWKIRADKGTFRAESKTTATGIPTARQERAARAGVPRVSARHASYERVMAVMS